MRNPNVTVRSRGVMEKCTYCVQRINAAKIDRKKKTAPCATAKSSRLAKPRVRRKRSFSATSTIKTSRVSKLKAQTRDYGLLEELNTRPRTTYLARVKNPNPEMRQLSMKRQHAFTE